MKPKRTTGVTAFLEASGILSSGTPEDIAAAKARYWSAYRNAWKKEKRKASHAFTVHYSDAELAVIRAAAKEHAQSPTTYIRESVLAYSRKHYLVPRREETRLIHDLLLDTYAALEEALETQVSSTALLERFSELENNVLSCLYAPQTLEEHITDAVSRNPQYRAVLLELLMPPSDDHQKPDA